MVYVEILMGGFLGERGGVVGIKGWGVGRGA